MVLSVSLVDAVADVLAGKRPVEEKEKNGLELGQEDGDIDNDGDKDSSDEYLMKKEKLSVKRHEERWWWKRT